MAGGISQGPESAWECHRGYRVEGTASCKGVAQLAGRARDNGEKCGRCADDKVGGRCSDENRRGTVIKCGSTEATLWRRSHSWCRLTPSIRPSVRERRERKRSRI